MRKEEKVPVSLSHEKELKLGKLLLRFPEVITRYGSYRYQLSIEVYYYCAESLTLDRKNQTTGRGRYHDT